MAQAATPAGYAQWSYWITSDQDDEGLVFRRFDKLAAFNLLYLQSEMMEIEERLATMNRESTGRLSPDAIAETFSLEALVAHCQPNHPRQPDAKERMDLILELRLKIKEYRRPNTRVVGTLSDMMRQGGVYKIQGKARHYLEAENDLVALGPASHEDYLSQFLRKRLARAETGLDPEKPRIARFEEAMVTTILNAITIAVATTFLVGPIIILYLVQTPWIKLLLVTLFTLGFAASVAVITKARRPEIFVGTATWVHLHFIGA
ncbi:hypothetical protein ACCO45_003009 [Purpureocillium lilacinum]|uniref:Uncharacterized protein n=1 Tax=Purpureocillium lilacinum TaxID=33203 RepID=A0ACC4DYP0_PURLI